MLLPTMYLNEIDGLKCDYILVFREQKYRFSANPITQRGYQK